jgi:uncharacterized protein (TIGR04141 family)
LKLNLFKIDSSDVDALVNKLGTVGTQLIHTETQAGWTARFFFSESPEPRPIPWAKTFLPFFSEVGVPRNLTHFAVYLFVKGDVAYAISYGKSHFYIRPFADYDFGIDLAKRIADENDTKQVAAKRFQGRQKKDIKSFTANSALDIESGESIDLLESSVASDKQKTFGAAGKFGASALLTPDIGPDDIGRFLDSIELEMLSDERFKLPRTTIVHEPIEIEKYDAMLVAELRSEIGITDFSQNSFDLYGVDFVFSSQGTFELRSSRRPKVELDMLTIKTLKAYIQTHELSDEEVLKIRVTHVPEEGPKYVSGLKDVLDYVVDEEQVVLASGKWMRFNQDYLDFLDEYVRAIDVEIAEPEFLEIWQTEPKFNSSEAVTDAGYSVADKNFHILRTASATPIEAWDLSREKTVYAVKFGTAQKLGYVCDQALTVLELIHNRAGVESVPSFEKYCLWLGYRGVRPLESIADSGSIILKQKIEAWARKARAVGVTPVLKISHRRNPQVDIVPQPPELPADGLEAA